MVAPVRHVVIVGGGFSGTLQAINLMRHDGPPVTLIERRATLARGVAYSAAHPDHLLNVRAGNMSAFPDDPGHFQNWLLARYPDAKGMFAPRIVYGDYLNELLAATVASTGGKLQICADEALTMNVDSGQMTVHLASGKTITADAVVLAPGNLPPLPPEGMGSDLSPDVYAHDPWQGDLAAGLTAEDTVLCIGTGLTMVDVALLLKARGFKGSILAVSRRGLLPREHADVVLPATTRSERPPLYAVELLRVVRARAERVGWRAAVDELRPYTQSMWLAAPAVERARFLRHLRPWWDVHRHRLAPQVFAALTAMQATGQLRVVAAKTIDFIDQTNAVEVSYRPRHQAAVHRLRVRRVINCTGPQGDLLRTREPLLLDLLAKGMIRPDSQRLGIDVTPDAQVIGADGKAIQQLYALGPMTRGVFWEIVAVPDIRVQTWAVARKLANAHWVEGEGL